MSSWASVDLYDGFVQTASYDIVSVALALEEGMITFLFLQKFLVFDVFIMYQCKTLINVCNKLLLCVTVKLVH
jgi:hypothetical protein